MQRIPSDYETYRQILSSYICDARRKLNVSDTPIELSLARSEVRMFLGMYQLKFGVTYDEHQIELIESTQQGV